MIKRSKKTRTKNRMIAILDAECRARVMERDKCCVRCGATTDLQWSHVLTRRHMCIRWDDENSKILCRACHCWWTNFPQEASYWFSQKWPLRWEYVNEMVRRNLKVNVALVYEESRKGMAAGA